MKKQSIISAALLAMVFAVSSAEGAANAGTAATSPQEQLTIAGKKPARFSHPVHLNMGLGCPSCHHDEQHNPLSAGAIGELAETAVLRCVSCHNSDHPNRELQKAKDVFHAKCKSCHKEGFAGKKGPTKCTSCHLKKKKKYEGC